MTPETLLLRQVNPSWIRNGRITSQVFRPTSKDKKRLSVYDGDQITPPEAHHHYTREVGWSSDGVMAVTMAECGRQDLPVTSDPDPFPEHAVIDFRACSNTEIRTKAKRLTEAAQLRGWQYREVAD